VTVCRINFRQQKAGDGNGKRGGQGNRSRRLAAFLD
jgi:hypothetical protein